MACLSNADIAKRNNIKILYDAIVNGTDMMLGASGSNGKGFPTGKIEIKLNGKTRKYDKINISDLNEYLQSNDRSKSLLIEMKVGKATKKVRLGEIFKSKAFGGTASKSGAGGSERQERGLVDAISESKKVSKKVYNISLGSEYNIISAVKNDPKDAGSAFIPHKKAGKEPYTDMIMNVSKNNKSMQLRVSMKGDSAPSLAGGGLSGLMDIDANLTKQIWNKASNFIKKKGYGHGDVIDSNNIPDISIRIPDDFVKVVLTGTVDIGGPITHMYIGPMDIVYNIDKSGKLTLNGSFYTISEYMKKIPDFYIVIRKRDIADDRKIKIDLTGETTNAEGLPVLMKNPKTNKNNTRVIVTNSPRGTLIK